MGRPVRASAAQSRWPFSLGEMAGRQDHGVVGVAGRRRDRRIGEPADPGRDAGNDAERDAGSREIEGFLAAPAEHEGVAALEPQHAPSVPGERDQPLGDVALCGRQLAAALPREFARSLRPSEAHDGVADERVVDDHVSLAQGMDGMQREEARVSRAGPAEPYRAGLEVRQAAGRSQQ